MLLLRKTEAGQSASSASKLPLAQASPDPRVWLQTFLSDRHLRVCAAITVVVALMPPEGMTGLDVCWLKYATGVPCPGCGITRSGSNLLRGNMPRAVNYHPLGPVLMPVIFALGVLALAPRRWRDGVRGNWSNWAAPFRRIYLAVIVLFVVFGVVRSFCVYEGWIAFPAAWP